MRLGPKQRGYTKRWDRLALAYKKRNPLCAMCLKRGRYRQAYAVDHIIPHKGDQVLMWDQNNWQSLCQDCHNRVKQQQEKRGYRFDVDEFGYPVDPNHPANF